MVGVGAMPPLAGDPPMNVRVARSALVVVALLAGALPMGGCLGFIVSNRPPMSQ